MISEAQEEIPGFTPRRADSTVSHPTHQDRDRQRPPHSPSFLQL